MSFHDYVLRGINEFILQLTQSPHLNRQIEHTNLAYSSLDSKQKHKLFLMQRLMIQDLLYPIFSSEKGKLCRQKSESEQIEGAFHIMSHDMRKPVFGIFEQSRHNWAVQPKKMSRGLKFRI